MKTILMTIISVIAFSLSSYAQPGGGFGDPVDDGLNDGTGSGGQSPYADLTIRTAVAYKLSQPGGAGAPMNVRVVLHIRNSAAAGAISDNNVATFYMSSLPGAGNYFTISGSINVPSLMPGGYAIVTTDITIPASVYYNLSAEVDANNTVPESNEYNNTNGVLARRL